MNHPDQEQALFHAISDIDPMLINEAAAPPARPLRSRLIRFGSMAAVLAVMLMALLLPSPSDSVTLQSTIVLQVDWIRLLIVAACAIILIVQFRINKQSTI